MRRFSLVILLFICISSYAQLPADSIRHTIGIGDSLFPGQTLQEVLQNKHPITPLSQYQDRTDTHKIVFIPDYHLIEEHGYLQHRPIDKFYNVIEIVCLAGALIVVLLYLIKMMRKGKDIEG